MDREVASRSDDLLELRWANERDKNKYTSRSCGHTIAQSDCRSLSTMSAHEPQKTGDLRTVMRSGDIVLLDKLRQVGRRRRRSIVKRQLHSSNKHHTTTQGQREDSQPVSHQARRRNPSPCCTHSGRNRSARQKGSTQQGTHSSPTHRPW